MFGTDDLRTIREEPTGPLTDESVCQLLQQLRVAQIHAELHVVLHREVLAQVAQILQSLLY